MELLKKKKLKLILSILIVVGGSLLGLYMTYNINSLLTVHQFSGYATPLPELIKSVWGNPTTSKMYLIFSGVFLLFGIIYFFSNDRPYHS
ncbi:Uncharacterised protein [Acetobacterium wieringae]|nr:Uncharacterised protein [Acetobacterium wieringae]